MDKIDTEMRLQLYMAKCGLASRRKCEILISEGLVKINGKVITQMGYKVGSADKVTFKGQLITINRNKIYLALNKPSLYLCSNSDPQGRPLAVELINKDFQERLYNVGRLDYLSTGVIFFTNDGDFTKTVAHPSSGI
ncbi:MAG: pseudouridine synthase, partial [Spirochaetales bacterium]|nr:pseudouridine synthase [Spirochaetales bacterium]